MNQLKRSIALILVLALGLSVLLIPSAAAPTADSEYGGTNTPVILIHGNTQSYVYLYEDDNKTPVLDDAGEPVKAWPPSLDLWSIVKQVIFPFLVSLIFQRDLGLTKSIKKVFKEAMSMMEMDAEGMPAHNLRVWSFEDEAGKPLSLAECSEEEQDFASRRLHMDERDPRLTDDYIYYFAYDTFGNNAYNSAALAQYIKDVSAKHGGVQVNLVPISLGGTLVNTLMEDYYDEIVPLLRSVVYVVAAIDGTNLMGDAFTRQLSVDNVNLYRDMFPALLEAFPDMMPSWMGYLINLAIRIPSKRLVLAVMDALIDVLVGEVFLRNTTMWSLVPSGYYETARAMWLTGDDLSAIRAQTDHYYQAQKNSRANIQRMVDDGVWVYALSDYDLPLIAIAGSYTSVNSDSVIHLDSTSLGATAGYINTPLPADYVPQSPTCTDPSHNHRSPDGIVDASTSLLPEQTWYFRWGLHDRTSQNDLAMRMIIRLLTATQYESVTTLAPHWPQFNIARESRELRIDLLPLAQSVDPSQLSAEDAAELAAAIAEAEAMLRKTVGNAEEYRHARDRVAAILATLGLREAERPDYAGYILKPLLSFAGDLLYCTLGPRGYFDPFWVKWK